MKEQTRTGLLILWFAVGLGLSADLLLRETPWGLNVLVINLLFVASIITLFGCANVNV